MASNKSIKSLIRHNDVALAILGGVLLAVGFVAAFGLPWIVTVLEVAR